MLLRVSGGLCGLTGPGDTLSWSPVCVGWEVALKESYNLSATVEALSEVKGNQVFRVTDPDREQSFCICCQQDGRLDRGMTWTNRMTGKRELSRRWNKAV